MKALLILALLMPMLLKAQTVTWSWDPVTQATNGDTITPTGYNLYCSFGDFTTIETTYSHDLQPGDHSCQVSTMLVNVESEKTIAYSFTVDELIPNMPKSINIEGEISLKITFE